MNSILTFTNPVPYETLADISKLTICTRCLSHIFITGQFDKHCFKKRGTLTACTNCLIDGNDCIAVPAEFAIQTERIFALHWTLIQGGYWITGSAAAVEIIKLTEDLSETIAECEAEAEASKHRFTLETGQSATVPSLADGTCNSGVTGVAILNAVEKLVEIETERNEKAERNYQMLMEINRNMERLWAELHAMRRGL